METRIVKSSSELRGANRCHVLRSHDDFKMETMKNSHYDDALAVKQIIKGFLQKEYTLADVHDLVSQCIQDEYETAESGKLRQDRLVKCIARYMQCEHRPAEFGERQTFQFGNYDITVKPDAIFRTPGSIELVLYRAGKPSVSMNGKKQDHSANQCLELYFLLLYARTLVKPGENMAIRASYYFMRKDKDTKIWDSDFFSGDGGNVVYIEEGYIGGQTQPTGYDQTFIPQLEDYIAGSECSEEDCKSCSLKTLCQYQKTPDVFERKTLGSKNGKIVPSDAQQQIIDFRHGVCRVNATAGSGKTECMTERGARMIEEGVAPNEILFITFTDAGAFEMKERIIKKCTARGLDIDLNDLQAMTFNTFAYRIVKDKYADCGFTKQPAVIDDVRNSVIITQMLDEKPISGLDYLNFKSNMPNCQGALACATRVFDLIKSNGLENNPCKDSQIEDMLRNSGWSRFYGANSIYELCNMYDEYAARLIEDNLLQFSDQEPMMNKILDLYPDYLHQFGYKHIIVDEFQDSNDVQLATIKRLTECPTFESLMVVGDDSQSIYGFRNTSPENILNFFQKLNMQGQDLYLTENRRSTPEILTLANKINDLNTEKVDKSMNATRDHGPAPYVQGFFSKQEEYEFIAHQIKKMIDNGTIPEDIAFIAAKKAELIAMAAELAKLNIPVVMKNPMPLLENSRVQAAMSLAEAFWQPEAEILYFNYLVAKYDGAIFDKGAEAVQNEIKALRHIFTTINTYDFKYQRILFHNYLEAIKGNDEIYTYFLELLYQNEDIQSELEYVKNFRQFGERVAKKMEQTYQGVVLTTAHSSKGLEWPVVFNSITGYDGEYLHRGKKSLKEVEEKRRLLFVSMTRARDMLYVTGQYVAYGKKGEYVYNQFLKECYDAMNMAYNPVDPNEDLKKAEKKRKALEKANVVNSAANIVAIPILAI